YAQDRLQPTPRWYVEFGGRVDRDGVLDRTNATPRVGTALLLDKTGNAVLRGGLGLFYDRTPSLVGAFDQFEFATDTRFAADGATLVGPPLTFVHATAPDLHTSRSTALNIAYDHRLNATWAIHAGVLAREGRHELIVQPVVAGESAELLLSATGKSVYREGEFGVHFTHSGVDINATYVRASSRADLNGFTSFFGTPLWPIVGRNEYAPT